MLSGPAGGVGWLPTVDPGPRFVVTELSVEDEVDDTGAGAATLDEDDTGAGTGAALDVEVDDTGAAALLVFELDVATGLAEVVSVVDPETVAAAGTNVCTGAGVAACDPPDIASTATAAPAAATPPIDAHVVAALFTLPSLIVRKA